jgi:hypothetical protein
MVRFDIVMYRPIARQRLGKHIPAGANARNNRTYTARQHLLNNRDCAFCVVRAKWL